jgi:hypothetical protein
VVIVVCDVDGIVHQPEHRRRRTLCGRDYTVRWENSELMEEQLVADKTTPVTCMLCIEKDRG